MPIFPWKSPWKPKNILKERKKKTPTQITPDFWVISNMAITKLATECQIQIFSNIY